MSSGSSVRRAFSLVELLTVLGLVSILLGLALPALRNARRQAERVRLQSNIHQSAIAVAAYCATFKGLYPYRDRHPAWIRASWPKIVIDAGLAERFWGVGPVALAASPYQMMMGRTVPFADLPPSPIGDHRVRFPSSKGMVWTPQIDGEFWCCDPSFTLEAPIAMCDGSAILASARDFLPLGLDVPERVDSIGMPVDTTWDGCLGRDILLRKSRQ